MGNTNSSFKAVPLASQLAQPVVVLSNATCFDAAVNVVVAPKLSLKMSYAVSINGHPYFTIKGRTFAEECTIRDVAGNVVATVRGTWSSTTDYGYAVHAGASGGKHDPMTPAAMVIKYQPDGLDVTTATGLKMRVVHGWTHAAIVLGAVPTTTAPLIARSESVGTFKATDSIWVAAGVDSTAVVAIWAATQMIVNHEGVVTSAEAVKQTAELVTNVLEVL
ncbi:hypothetical protein H9P43_009909 [Blastocladiella emersonii ATCC 22665]|nr:hypothetical protein H9P43_009909 [Blastocladiella emersonii ATCC 22665]